MVGQMTSRQLRPSFEQESARLEQFFNRKQTAPFQDPENTIVPSEVVSRMKGWATSLKSQLLYLSGSGDSQDLSNVAAQYVAYAHEAKVPIASYFCQLSAPEPPAGRTRETIEAVALVYALIRQLIELLPMELDASCPQLDASGFQNLDGTMASWSEALSLLEQMMGMIDNPILVLVIDGFDALDDSRSTTSRLRDFLQVLRRRVMASRGPVLKVLFTSPGESAALKEILDPHEISLNTGMRRKNGRPMAGRDHVSF
jgi:hypothetical protein